MKFEQHHRYKRNRRAIPDIRSEIRRVLKPDRIWELEDGDMLDAINESNSRNDRSALSQRFKPKYSMRINGEMYYFVCKTGKDRDITFEWKMMRYANKSCPEMICFVFNEEEDSVRFFVVSSFFPPSVIKIPMRNDGQGGFGDWKKTLRKIKNDPLVEKHKIETQLVRWNPESSGTPFISIDGDERGVYDLTLENWDEFNTPKPRRSRPRTDRLFL
jgi:hypothetical protein